MLDALDRLCAGRTVIVATHSPAVIERADRVVQLARGRVIDGPMEEGTGG